jgi:hypothetical protein
MTNNKRPGKITGSFCLEAARNKREVFRRRSGAKKREKNQKRKEILI